MAGAAQFDILADRQAPCVKSFTFVGRDFTGSTFLMQARATKDTTGTPFIDTSGTVPAPGGVYLSYGGSDTIANHTTASRLTADIYNYLNPATGEKYQSADTIALSVVTIAIDAATNSSAAEPSELGDDSTYYYDVYREPAGSPTDMSNEVILRGKYVVQAGVTIP